MGKVRRVGLKKVSISPQEKKGMGVFSSSYNHLLFTLLIIVYPCALCPSIIFQLLFVFFLPELAVFFTAFAPILANSIGV